MEKIFKNTQTDFSFQISVNWWNTNVSVVFQTRAEDTCMQLRPLRLIYKDWCMIIALLYTNVVSSVDTSSPNVISPLALGEEFSTHAQLDSIAFLSAQFSVWSSKYSKPHNPCDIFLIFLAMWTFSSWVLHKSVQRSIAGFKIESTDRTLKVCLHSIHFQVCNIFSHRRLSFRYINSDQLFGDYLPKRWHSVKFRETRSNTETLTGNFHIQHGIQYFNNCSSNFLFFFKCIFLYNIK